MYQEGEKENIDPHQLNVFEKFLAATNLIFQTKTFIRIIF